MTVRGMLGTAAIVLATLTMLTARGSLAGEEKHSAAVAREGSSTSMVRSYAGPQAAHVGTFAGKLVCLRCDIKPGPGAMAQCEKEGHHHALSMDADSMVHPLLSGTADVLQQINSAEFHGKDVTVHGKHYPSTGAILVDKISASK
jgi:hypothetical protein